MKATHVVITNESHYLERGERVILIKGVPVFSVDRIWVQSINPSYGDGQWCTRISNLKPLPNTQENK